MRPDEKQQCCGESFQTFQRHRMISVCVISIYTSSGILNTDWLFTYLCVVQTVNALHYLKENHGVIHRGTRCVYSLIKVGNEC